MARKQLTEEERQQIRDSINATRERRKNQSIKVIELKVNCHNTSKEDFSRMLSYFIQAKWITNDMLSCSIDGNQNIFKYEYKEHKTVLRFNKDGSVIEEEVSIPAIMHKAIVTKVKTDICNLAKAKKKGIKIGGLKFKSEINSIPLITGSFKIKDKTHITIPGFRNLKVYGLNQLDKYKEYELADGRFIKKPSGYYIHLSVCIPKTTNYKEKYREVGLDFGIKDSIITSDGEKFNCNVQESEYLKYLQKQLHRKKVGSKRYYKLRNQIQREYEHLSNKKTDVSNKLIAYLLNNYDTIYFQDENISEWKKVKRNKKGKKCGFSFGRQVRSSCLGRVKAKLVSLEGTRSYKISKWCPTTKFCPNCGHLKNISLDERIYTCECGYTFDRDIHAANNVKLFGSTQRAECLEQASVETVTSIVLNKVQEGKSGRRNENKEATTL